MVSERMESHQQPELLIAKILSGSATDQDRMDFEKWINASPDHVDVFLRLSQLWENDQREQFPVDEGLDLLQTKIERAERKSGTPLWMKVAASLLVVAVAAYIIFSTRRDGISVSYSIVRNDSLNFLRVSLPDQSHVVLRRGSEIKFPEKFIGSTRQLVLTGDAFFDVARDPSKPFIVQTGKVETKVLGTSFNIRQTNQLVDVSVASGKVQVSNGRTAVQLRPGQRARYETHQQLLSVAETSIAMDTAWMSNHFVFSNTRLSEAVKFLEARFQVTVNFESDKLRACRFTGTFSHETLDHILFAIGYGTGISYKIEGTTVTLSGKGCVARE